MRSTEGPPSWETIELRWRQMSRLENSYLKLCLWVGYCSCFSVLRWQWSWPGHSGWDVPFLLRWLQTAKFLRACNLKTQGFLVLCLFVRRKWNNRYISVPSIWISVHILSQITICKTINPASSYFISLDGIESVITATTCSPLWSDSELRKDWESTFDQRLYSTEGHTGTLHLCRSSICVAQGSFHKSGLPQTGTGKMVDKVQGLQGPGLWWTKECIKKRSHQTKHTLETHLFWQSSATLGWCSLQPTFQLYIYFLYPHFSSWG